MSCVPTSMGVYWMAMKQDDLLSLLIIDNTFFLKGTQFTQYISGLNSSTEALSYRRIRGWPLHPA